MRVPHRVHAALKEIHDTYGIPMATLAAVVIGDALGQPHPQRDSVRRILRDWKKARS